MKKNSKIEIKTVTPNIGKTNASFIGIRDGSPKNKVPTTKPEKKDEK